MLLQLFGAVFKPDDGRCSCSRRAAVLGLGLDVAPRFGLAAGLVLGTHLRPGLAARSFVFEFCLVGPFFGLLAPISLLFGSGFALMPGILVRSFDGAGDGDGFAEGAELSFVWTICSSKAANRLFIHEHRRQYAST